MVKNIFVSLLKAVVSKYSKEGHWSYPETLLRIFINVRFVTTVLKVFIKFH